MLSKILAFLLLIIWLLVTLILCLTVLPGIIAFTVAGFEKMPFRLLEILKEKST